MSAVVAMVKAYDWPLMTADGYPKPKVYRGARLSVNDAVDGSGNPIPIVICCYESTPGENGNLGNIRAVQRAISLNAGLPWLDSDLNEEIREDLATELNRIIIANTHPGGITLAAIGDLEWGRMTLSGPKGVQSYRAVRQLIKGKDIWTAAT